jgi:hypothetical protein
MYNQPMAMPMPMHMPMPMGYNQPLLGMPVGMPMVSPMMPPMMPPYMAPPLNMQAYSQTQGAPVAYASTTVAMASPQLNTGNYSQTPV